MHLEFSAFGATNKRSFGASGRRMPFLDRNSTCGVLSVASEG